MWEWGVLNAVSQYIIKAFIVAYNTTIIVTKPGIGMNHRKTIKAVKMCNLPHCNRSEYSDRENWTLSETGLPLICRSGENNKILTSDKDFSG